AVHQHQNEPPARKTPAAAGPPAGTAPGWPPADQPRAHRCSPARHRPGWPGLDHNLQQPEKTGEDRAAGFDNIAQANRHMVREETRPLRLLQTCLCRGPGPVTSPNTLKTPALLTEVRHSQAGICTNRWGPV